MTEPDCLPRLHVCITCRAGRTLAPGETPPGALLHAVVAGPLGATLIVRRAAVACPANCECGCSAAISAAGKRTYLLGGRGPAHDADLPAYAAAANGAVMPSRRPVSLARAAIVRTPAPELLA